MKNNELRKAVKKALEYPNKADCAIQVVNRLLKHERFIYNEPNASLCSGDEFIVEYLGSEISIEQAIDIMEERGYLVPEDFHI